MQSKARETEIELEVTPEMSGMTDLRWPKHSSCSLVGLRTSASLFGTADTLLTSSAATALVIFELVGFLRARGSLGLLGFWPSNRGEQVFLVGGATSSSCYW
ncbi:MAG: hypothetical protein CL912_24530 [Deltaproteobacteria bacterium]|nr:hypothetical protein [Deltaproteobacteria bacterium]